MSFTIRLMVLTEHILVWMRRLGRANRRSGADGHGPVSDRDPAAPR